ncbi:MAG: hypothetical protein LBS40_08695 [Burkholderiales bacterium]|jgi:hypothetical protein|nr:hypothetical protein [Burkholderiales bacterium]
MIKLSKHLVWLVALILYPNLSFAYEVSTHAALTREAYQRSMLQNTDLLERLGIAIFQENLGEIYFDINPSSGEIIARKSNPTEKGDEIGLEGYTLSKFIAANRQLPDDEQKALLTCPHFFDPIEVEIMVS